MKKVLFILFITSYACTAQTNEVSVNDLTWLEGTWKRSNNRTGRISYERWMTSNTDELVGLGVTLAGTDTVFTEKLKIVKKENKLYYVAEVAHNAAPVLFEIELTGKNSFISRNPEHDFPKEIAYQLNENQLTAIISGDGKSMNFIFDKASE